MARIEDLFWDNIPDDGEWHRLEVNVKGPVLKKKLMTKWSSQ